MVKVSVLIPVYNAENFIKESISSILNQTFSDFELILLDDASTDNSEAVISQFNDPRIRCYKNERNLGISGTRNKLMDLASGEYLAVMDNDDLSLPDRLAVEVAFLDAHRDVAMLGGWMKLFCAAPARTLKAKIKKMIVNLGWVWRQPAEVTLKETLRGNTCMHSSMMLRADDMRKHNIRYNAEYTPAEDYDLVRQVLAAGLKVRNLQRVLIKYHLHGDNFSIKKKQLMKKADLRVKADICRDLSIPFRRKYPYWLIILRKLRPDFSGWKNNA